MTLLDLIPGAAKRAEEPEDPPRVYAQPVSSVFADLLPDEVRTRRRLRYLKGRMAFGLVALALVIGLGDALARQQTNAASDDLAAANLRISALNQQVTRFSTVVGVQTETQQITTLLSQAMTGDVPWAKLTARLQALAPDGLSLTGVDGEVGAGNGDAPAPVTSATPGTSTATPTVVGSLSLTGTATGYRAVADYVSALVAVPGLTAVNPATTSTGAEHGSLTFTITASLTTAAQGGRYAPAATAGPTTPAAATPAAATPAAGTPATGTPAGAPAATSSTPATPVGN